jgi:hypothetical protein
MKGYVCLLAAVVLSTACSKKETTVTNPPAENATEGAAANTPVTNLPSGKTETKTTTTTVNQSPTPDADLSAESSTPSGDGSSDSSSDADAAAASGGTTQGTSSFIGGASSSDGAAPDMTVSPARAALRNRGALPSPTP